MLDALSLHGGRSRIQVLKIVVASALAQLSSLSGWESYLACCESSPVGKLKAIQVGPEQQHCPYHCKVFAMGGVVGTLGFILRTIPISNWLVGSSKLRLQKSTLNIFVASIRVNGIGALRTSKRECEGSNIFCFQRLQGGYFILS